MPRVIIHLMDVKTQRPRAGGGRSGRNIEANLKKHFELMKKYEAEGHSKEEASRLAMQELGIKYS